LSVVVSACQTDSRSSVDGLVAAFGLDRGVAGGLDLAAPLRQRGVVAVFELHL
jgi:hypothetical protein